MKPEIVLIRAYGRDDGYRCIPWGIVNIASYLKKYGYRVTIFDRKEGDSIPKIIKEISSRDNLYVGISAMTSQAEDAESLCKYLGKKRKNIILGGLHYSIYPQDGLKIGDYVFKGEGERSLLNFLENGRKAGVYESEPILDLDEIPLPGEDLINRLYIHKSPFTIMTSRGCIYNCAFCLDKKYRFDKIRYHSPVYVCDLIEMLVKSFNIRDFFIGDDVFAVNKNRALEICREIKKRGLKIKLLCFTHSGIGDLQLYKEMRSAGFEAVSLGVESGSDEVLAAMNKQQTVGEIRKTIEIIKKAGLKVSVTFMVGNISETEESLKDTLALAEELQLCGWVSYAQPFPGTKFYELASQYGKITNSNPKTYWNDRITFIPTGISKPKLKYYHDKIAIALKAPLPWLTRLKNKIY